MLNEKRGKKERADKNKEEVKLNELNVSERRIIEGK